MAKSTRKRCKKGMHYSPRFDMCVKKKSIRRTPRPGPCAPGTERRKKHGCLSDADWAAVKQAKREARCPFGWNPAAQRCKKGTAAQRRARRSSQRRSKARAIVAGVARKARMSNTRKFAHNYHMDQLVNSLSGFHVSKPKRKRTRKKASKKAPRRSRSRTRTRSPGHLRRHVMGMNMAGLMGGPLA